MAIRPPLGPWGTWAWDTGERALRAYAGSFASLVAADQTFTKFDLVLWETLVAALVGVIVSTLFSLAGKAKGSNATASLLPTSKTPEAPPPTEPTTTIQPT